MVTAHGGAALPSGVAETGKAKSRPGACCPPEVRHHTDRLCSAGSGVLPRYPASSLVCGPPTPLRLRPCSGFPRGGLPPGTDAFLSRPGVRPSTPGASERVDPGSPSPRTSPRTVRGLPGYRTAHCPRAVVVHPASGDAASPTHGDAPCCLQGYGPPRLPGTNDNFGAAVPRPTCSPAYASTGALPLRLQG